MLTLAAVPAHMPAAASVPALPAPAAGAPVAGAVVSVINAAVDLALIAGVAIPGHRAVYLMPDGTAVPASADDPSCAGCLGIALGTAAAGASIHVRRLGLIADPSFTFAVGPVWLGLPGALTQVRPAAGLHLQLGFALAPNRLLVHPRPATILAP